LFLTFDELFHKKKNKLLSFIQYKLTKLYFNVIYEKKRNMNKTIKFPVTLLFVFLFSMTEKIASRKDFIYTLTPRICRINEDCPMAVTKPELIIYVCMTGYCVKATLNPKYWTYGG
jgi:hypothetical protein